MPGYAYPDQQLTLHRFAKAYGWTQHDIDQTNTEDLDWLAAIQNVEVELQKEAQEKQEAQIKQMSMKRGRR